MAWHSSLAVLRDVLAQLAPRREESELIVDDAGIPRERVRFSEQADVSWHEILRVAERLSRIPALLDVLLIRYPGVTDLMKAVEACRDALPSGASSAATARQESYPPSPVDLAVVTAMTEELEPILTLLGGRSSWSEFTLEGYLHRWKTIDLDGVSCTIVAHSLWKYGGDPASNEVARLRTLRPRLVAMSGICAGWEGKDDIIHGDVIVAERAFNPSEGKREVAKFHADVQTFSPPPWLVHLIKDFAATEGWQEEINVERPAGLTREKPKVHVGTFASDAPILAVAEPFKEPASQVRKVRAYDLEVKSFLNAAMEFGVPAFAVKGVSDYFYCNRFPTTLLARSDILMPGEITLAARRPRDVAPG